MPSTASDKALRALVAELAATTPEDMAAVLAMLDARAVARLRPLIAAHASPEPAPVRLDTSGVSGWLADRVLGGKGNGGEDAWRMTPAAAAALRTLAAALPHLATTSTPPARQMIRGEGLGLFRRFSSQRPGA